METSVVNRSQVSQADFESSLVSALERIGKPISVKNLRSALPKPFQRTPAELAMVLDRFVSERRVYKTPSKTPAYSRADPEALARAAVLAALERGPASAAVLSERLAVEVPGYPLKVLVERLVSEGRVHPRYKLSKSGKPGKTAQDYALGPPPPPPPPPRAIAEQSLPRELEGGPLPAAELKRRVTARAPGLAAPEFTAVLAELVQRGRVHPQHARKNGIPSGKVIAYALVPEPAPDARIFVASAAEELRSAVAAASSFGVPPAALLAALIEASAVDPSAVFAELTRRGGARGASAAAGDARPSALDSKRDHAEVLARLRALVAAERAGALVPLARLRAALHLDKARFDAVVLDLARADAVILHHHDLPGALSESARAELVVDGFGTHYVGIALGRKT